MEFNGINLKGLVKNETIGLLKTAAAILAALWLVAEPYVEEYVHEQVHIVQEEDKMLIDSLESKLSKLQGIVDEDYHTAKSGRNKIIQELQFLHRRTRIQLEK